MSKEYRERRREREDDRSRRKEYTTSRRRTDDSGIGLIFIRNSFSEFHVVKGVTVAMF